MFVCNVDGRTMKNLLNMIRTAIVLSMFVVATLDAVAQSPRNKDFGFGIILGEPTGGTVKFWLNRENAITASIGASYFGSPRLGADYLWHFDAFSSSVVKLYAGPGLAIGFGEGKGFWYKEGKDRFWVREGSETGFAFRGIFGVNVVPRNTPLEIFFELGPLVGVTPDFGSAFDAAVGVRFYP